VTRTRLPLRETVMGWSGPGTFMMLALLAATGQIGMPARSMQVRRNPAA
jgi:hypothetical protein